MEEEIENIELLKLKAMKLTLLEEQLRLQSELPHRYLFKFYEWQRQFFDDTTTRLQLVVSGNQCGKSVLQIRKIIELACNKSLWKEAWPNLRIEDGIIPNLFFYFYPDLKLATTEWHFKWKSIMPKNKDDPDWGWEEVFDQRKLISEIRFKSGVTIQFKAYSQDVISLQASSPYYIAVDEEPYWHIMPEIMSRLNSTNGLFSAAFTATIGQEEWERIVEKRSLWQEARVWQVSLYDCQYYEDGTASHWTDAAIKQVISRCATEKDVLMRVMGRFVKSDRLVYQNFTSDNRCDIAELSKIKDNWPKFAGIDYGGGGTSHPSAIVFIAVHPDFTSGYVYKCWRGDGVITTANDVLTKYIDMRADDNVWFAFYDWAAKDLGTIAERSGLALIRAEKSHDIGEGVLNSLFKNKMLKIPFGDEFDKLASELNNLSIDTPKTKARDDLCFSGDTLIETKIGEKRIDALNIGDMVLTRKGYRKVTSLFKNDNFVSNYMFGDGTILKATDNHPIFSLEKEFAPISSLTHQDTCISIKKWKKLQKQSNSTELFIEDTQIQKELNIQNTLLHTLGPKKMEPITYIETFGNFIMGQYQKVITFTIKMVTLLTTIFPIFHLLKNQNTQDTICLQKKEKLNLGNQLNMLLQKHQNGMPQKKGMIGINSTGKNQLVTNLTKQLMRFAINVELILRQNLCKDLVVDFVPISVSLPGAGILDLIMSQENAKFAQKSLLSINIPRLRLVEKHAQWRLQEKQKVYNIEVEDANEYFANGILVHNCDALRYSSSKVPWLYKAPPMAAMAVEKTEQDLRREAFMPQKDHDGLTSTEEEIEFWADLLA